MLALLELAPCTPLLGARYYAMSMLGIARGRQPPLGGAVPVVIWWALALRVCTTARVVVSLYHRSLSASIPGAANAAMAELPLPISRKCAHGAVLPGTVASIDAKAQYWLAFFGCQLGHLSVLISGLHDYWAVVVATLLLACLVCGVWSVEHITNLTPICHWAIIPCHVWAVHLSIYYY